MTQTKELDSTANKSESSCLDISSEPAPRAIAKIPKSNMRETHLCTIQRQRH